MTRTLLSVPLLAAAAVGVLWAGQFGFGPVVVTQENEFDIVLFLGTPRKTIDRPGIELRVPFLETVESFDKGLQHASAQPVDLLVGNQTLSVETYAVWRIGDPLAFRRSYPGGKAEASIALRRHFESLVGDWIGKHSLGEVIARSSLAPEIDREVSDALLEKGVVVVDLRVHRTALPSEAQPAVFEQMGEQRRTISRELRAHAEREAREMRARAEREAGSLVARATSQAQIARGEADAQAAAIYAAAHGRDPEFYAFVRSLEAYRAGLGERTTLVLTPDHEFFRALQSGAPPNKPGPRSAR